MRKAKVQPNEKTKKMLNYPARGEVLGENAHCQASFAF